MAQNRIPKKYFLIIAVFATINILLLVSLLSTFTSGSDSEQYFQTARYFKGEAAPVLSRLLKPIMPFFIAVFSYIFGLGPAFLLINGIFYFFTGFIVFKIIKILFVNDKQALIGSLLFLSAYPMLEYGVSWATDLSGWFFFALSVYLTLLFLKNPNYKLVTLNGLVCAAGFLARESGGMGILFFFICLFFVYKDSFINKIKYLLGFASFFAIPFFAWQAFVYLRFHYSYYDWYLAGAHSSPIFLKEIPKLFMKSLGAAFLLGWIFVFIGLAKFKKMPDAAKKISLALVLPSFSFLLWFGASSRLYYIVGLLLSILASWGIASINWTKKKYAIAMIMIFILAGNYFWLIFDDKLRYLIKNLFRVTY